MKAGAAYLNSKAGGGGLAGRKVVVDFYDSKLNGNESRNATIQGCENDYALVGTSALFLTEVNDIVNCADQAGAADGHPRHVGGHHRRARVVLGDVVPGLRHRHRLLRP